MSGPVPASPDRMPLADRHGVARPQPAIGTPLRRRDPSPPSGMPLSGTRCLVFTGLN
jgi:hypothetical protein